MVGLLIFNIIECRNNLYYILQHSFRIFLQAYNGNQLDPAPVQLAQTNIELRNELNHEVDINRTNERKIRKLMQSLIKRMKLMI